LLNEQSFGILLSILRVFIDYLELLLFSLLFSNVQSLTLKTGLIKLSIFPCFQLYGPDLRKVDLQNLEHSLT